jgi:DNA repair exonuclease SbcCD ATPase subunit/predicted phosphodiesterase
MKIVQISDIHIRLFKRYKEYLHVFKNLYKSLEEQKVDRIVIVGDLVHNKNSLSPEAVVLLSNLLSRLSEIAPVDIIIGNHDCIVNQPNRVDSITPIVDSLANDRIFVYDKSGIFSFPSGETNWVNYGVFAINDEDNYPIHIPDKKDNEYYIALFHGAINRATTDVDYVLKTKNSYMMFDEYDFAFLGDIHKMQHLRERDGLPIISYSGSLVQQNFGESIGKGYLLWDLPDDKTKPHSVDFIEVPNDYGYYTIEINKDNIDKIDELCSDPLIPKKPYVRIFVDTVVYNVLTLKNIANYVREQLNPLSLAVETNIESMSKELSVKELEIENVYQLPVQRKLLKEWFELSGVPLEEINQILEIHEELFNLSVSDEKSAYGSTWTINNMHFDNTFSYGNDNSIDFNLLPGLVGIFSPNASGKSALLDSMLMGFFNMSSRATRKNVVDVINKNQNKAAMELNFDVDGRRYRINRRVERRKEDSNRASNYVSLWDVTDGDDVLLSGDNTTRQTESMIRDLLGEFYEHSLTSFGLQNDLTSFIEMNQASRKEMLAKFMGLDIIDQLYIAVSDECRTLKTLIDQFKKHDYRSAFRTFEEEKIEIAQQTTDIESDRDGVKKDIGRLQEHITSLNSTIKDIDHGIISRDEIDKQMKFLEGKVAEAKQTRDLSRVAIDEDRITESEIQTSMTDLGDEDTLKEKADYFKEQEKRLATLKSDNRIIEIDLSNHKKMTSVLDKHDWFTTTDVCQKCTFLAEAFKSKESIPDAENAYEAMLTEIGIVDTWLNENRGIPIRYASLKKEKQEHTEIWQSIRLNESRLQHAVDNIEHFELAILSVKEAENDHEANIEIIEQNASTSVRIDKLEEELKVSNAALTKYDYALSNLKIKAVQVQQRLDDLVSSIDKLEEVESSYRQHSYLKDSLSKDGIQLDIIKKVIPIINLEIKKILANLPDFEIIMEIDDDSQDIYIYIEDSTRRRIELGSGMERTIAAIALRAAMSNISLLPRCNLFVIDEGFGTLDTENLNNMNMLLGYLKSIFNTVLIISHVEVLQDICDHIISIDKDAEGYSKIKIT